jgi:hypothetical protein
MEEIWQSVATSTAFFASTHEIDLAVIFQSGILVVSIAPFFWGLCQDLTGHTRSLPDRHGLQAATSRQFEFPPLESRVC